jgi:murein DD-endopeptidase MepM/ murein hydrolase activator NlpD
MQFLQPEAPAQDAQTPGAARPGKIELPIAGLKLSDLHDTFNETRGDSRRHGAQDILAPRGTPVHAVVEGNVVKLFTSEKGGLTVYQFDNAREYCYYYAHLDRYAEGLREGMLLRPGDVLGYVGSTGNADPRTPHLHFEILRLGPDKQWWKGTPVNPYPLLVEALR